MRSVNEEIQSNRQHSRLLRIAIVLALWGVAGGLPLEAKRSDDVVAMRNGDTFTGEIKKLTNGILYFKSTYMLESTKLNWDLVDRLESKDQFNVSLVGVQRANGLIEIEKGTSSFLLRIGILEKRVPLAEVISIVPVEESLWQQLNGSIDYGFSFTSGNNAAQSSLSSQVKYISETWGAVLNGSSVFNSSKGSPRSGRNNLDFIYSKTLTQDWFAAATSTLLNSEQQDLTLRVTAGGGVGRDFIKSGTMGLFALAGVVFSKERYSSAANGQAQNQVEAQIQVRVFKSTFKTMQFNAQLVAYPNLTTLGRVRLGTETDLKIELVKDLYWKFSIYENYDSRPPGNTPKNDFGTTASLGWTF